jgi:putative transposase
MTKTDTAAHVNHKKLYRLYREEQLMLRRRRGRKRAPGTRMAATGETEKREQHRLSLSQLFGSKLCPSFFIQVCA